MIAQSVEKTIHFSHLPCEIEELQRAVIPMTEFISRCSSGAERQSMYKILQGRFFREADVFTMRQMLTRAVKFSRSHMDEYFPSMRSELLINGKLLEDALARYYESFQEWRETTPATH
jgi:hypothetical protein